MLCLHTHRRLKPGTFEQFPKAWEPDQLPDGIRRRIYHVRSLENPDEIIWFGLLDAGRDDLPGLRDRFGGQEAESRRQYRMQQFVEWTGVDGVFEVIEELRIGSESGGAASA